MNSFLLLYRVGIAINHITFHHGRTGSKIGYFSLCVSCVIYFSFLFIFPLSHCTVSFQGSMPEVIVKAYVSRLKRADARPLDLESATRDDYGSNNPHPHLPNPTPENWY